MEASNKAIAKAKADAIKRTREHASELAYGLLAWFPPPNADEPTPEIFAASFRVAEFLNLVAQTLIKK